MTEQQKSLQVEKLGKQILVSFDTKSIKIQGDSIQKKVKSSRSCVCLPSTNTNIASNTIEISHRNTLQAFYNEKTNMIQLHVLIQDHVKESTSTLYKLMYSVLKDEKEKAIQFCQSIMTLVYKDLIPEKRLKILINPFGGQGRAKTLFENKVKPLFEAAKCKLDIQYTEHHNHALEIAKLLPIQDYDAIVTVSGDGLIHEVINGFLQRPDAREAIQSVSLGIIPAGTSNSLCISLAGEKLGFDPIYCGLQIIKGRPLSIDICSVTFDDHRYFSFLSQNFGIAAYADIGTEHMRWMGDVRVTVGLLQKIFANRTYKIEASFLIGESDKTKIKQTCSDSFKASVWKPLASKEGAVVDTIPPLNEPVPDTWMTVRDDISFILTSKVPLLNRGMLSHPCALPNDGYIDMLLVRGNKGIGKQLNVFTHVENGDHLNLDIVEYYKVKAFRLKPIVQHGKEAYLAIDGEHAPAKEFQIEVHPCLGSVLSLHPTFIDTHLQ